MSRTIVQEYLSHKNKRGSLRRPAENWPLTTALLRSLAPPRQILFLLRAEPVDLDSHRLQLKLSHSLVEFVGNLVDLFVQRLEILDHVLHRERLVGKAHIHHRPAMSLGRRQNDQATLAAKADL